jgi:hypothetical protein
LPHPRIVDLRQQDQDEDELSYENFIRESMEKSSVGTRENDEQDQNEDYRSLDLKQHSNQNKPRKHI